MKARRGLAYGRPEAAVTLDKQEAIMRVAEAYLHETRLEGAPALGVHEALDLDRFRSPLLKPMLALRVPRRRNWRFGL